jgi:hypothetical protein
MSQKLIPNNGNDKVNTPEWLAVKIINHFNISGSILDPCKGGGAFYNNFPKRTIKDWAEIDEGRDFLLYNNYIINHFDWIVTNPPWSKFRAFLNRAMELSDNIVFLCLINAFFMNARMRDMKEKGFSIKEIVKIENPPKKPWPQTGLALGTVHINKENNKNIIMNFL